MTTTTNYTIREYSTGDAIGECDLTDEQYRRWERLTQQPEGIAALRDIPGHVIMSTIVPDTTTVWLD